MSERGENHKLGTTVEERQREEALRLAKEARLFFTSWNEKARNDYADALVHFMCLARAQPQQEPVAWIPKKELEFMRQGSYRESVVFNFRNNPDGIEPLYASPPAQAAPEGWVLVPEEVLRQLRHYTDCYLTKFPECGAPTKMELDRWLSAAPTPGGK